MAVESDPADLTGLHIPMSRETRTWQNRRARRAMRKMAEALDIDVARPEYLDPNVLWDEIKLRTAGGKLTSPQSEAPSIGDGFAIFVRAICTNHREPMEHIAVHKTPNGFAYDEFEARKCIDYLKREMATCPDCGEPITTFHCEQNRMSVYAANERVRPVTVEK